MTDKELLHQLLRRNHQLTAKCGAFYCPGVLALLGSA